MNFVIRYIIFILLFSPIFMHMEGIAKDAFEQCYWYISCPKLAKPILVYRLTRPIFDSIYHST